MRPGVTTLPVPSMIVAPGGSATLGPTATIRPLDITTEPFATPGPAPVRILTLRMTVGVDGAG